MTYSINTNEIIKRIHMGGFAFSIFSLLSSFFMLILILFSKILSSLTYDFLRRVFISELIGNIGKILEYEVNDGKLLCDYISLLFIPFSDIYTMTLFCFFSKCSVELIIKSNRNIKEKEKMYFKISLFISGIYAIFIFILLRIYEVDNNIRFYFYEDSKLNYLRFIHIGFLMIMTCYMSYNTFIVIQFLEEKKKSDKINAWKIVKLIKVLLRFPLICFFYWILYIPSLSLTYFDGSKKKFITYIIMLFSVSFFSLRGFLLFLNTIQTNKVQIVLERLIINFKHRFILLSKNRRWSTKDKNKKKGKDED